MKDYKLSIITVNLNNADGLRQTIESVIVQTFGDVEYIIIDGDSDDGSKEVIKEYEDRISFCISEQDSGIYNAMNKGIEKATGDYCLFLNSGDFLLTPHILEEVFSLNISTDFIYGDITYQNSSGRIFSTSLPSKLTIQFFYSSSLWHQATFIKRSLFKKYRGYNEENRLISDWEFFLKTIILEKCSYKKIDLVVTHYDMYNGLSVKDNNLRIIELTNVINKLFPPYVKALLDDYQLIENENKQYMKSVFYKLYRKYSKLKRLVNVLL